MISDYTECSHCLQWQSDNWKARQKGAFRGRSNSGRFKIYAYIQGRGAGGESPLLDLGL